MLTETLWTQNYFWRGIVKEIIPRPEYLQKLEKDLTQKEVQILMGARRVGKTYLMYSLIQSLIKSGIQRNRILFCILNDYDLKGVTIAEIIKEFRSIHGIGIDEKIYVFLDEVQYVTDWDQQVTSLYDTQNIKIVVSGSSSLLIKRQSTFLTGRQLKYTIYPLDFGEFLNFRNYEINPAENYLYPKYLQEYFECGGFPDMVLNRNTQYLADLIDAILFKDIVSVYNLDQPKLLKEILIWLATHLRQPVSYSKLTKVLNQKSDVTVKQYLEYLKEVYQILEIRRFSPSLSEQMTSPKKFYFSDIGMRNTLINGFKDEGSVAENILYIHLCNKYGQDNVFYYYQNQLEVDFIVRLGAELLAFESKYTDDIEIDSKGLSGVRQLMSDEDLKVQKTVVVTKNVEKIEEGIEFVPLYKILLGGRSLVVT
jgi:predicted AAA+ superfamily ATPase